MRRFLRNYGWLVPPALTGIVLAAVLAVKVF